MIIRVYNECEVGRLMALYVLMPHNSVVMSNTFIFISSLSSALILCLQWFSYFSPPVQFIKIYYIHEFINLFHQNQIT